MNSRIALVSVLLCAGSTLGCGWNYTPTDNLLPEGEGEASEDDGPPPVETGDTGGAEDVPATYRFDCIDIKQLGDADQEVFQVATLQNTWAADIANFRLNILIDIVDEDPDLGEAVVAIRSGVGFGWSDQCSQSETESAEHVVVLEPGVPEWEPSGSEESCAQLGDSAPVSGSYDIEFAAEDFVYIYAEDNEGTAFNCKVGGSPNAVPIAGLTTQITLSEDRGTISGTMRGCLPTDEGLSICSCLSVCSGPVHEDCPGCPGGAVPLGLLLGGINSTPYCTDLLGEDAFDVVLEFTASRLAEFAPTCG